MGLVSAPLDRPLILTLRLDAESQKFFDAQRERFFPSTINYLRAHITLFHKLPGLELTRIEQDLQQAVDRQAAFPVGVTGLRNLGRGVAYTLESSVLVHLRDQLVKRWSVWLTPQDLQKFRPHLTVQNKVTKDDAQSTFALLGTSFRPHSIQAIGLDLWSYEGGPWGHVKTYNLA